MTPTLSAQPQQISMVTSTSSAESVVLYPSPGMGHLVSILELAKLLLEQNLAVTILIAEPHYNTGNTASFISSVSAAHPSISFHRLAPSIYPLPPNPSPHHEALAFDLLRLSNPALRRFLLAASPVPLALVVDIFCGYALDVTAELSIPCFNFFTSGAAVLAAFLRFPVLHAESGSSFRQLGRTPLDVPGIPPLPADHMPLPMLDRGDVVYEGFLYNSTRLADYDGIIINTFDSLEQRAVSAIEAHKVVGPGRKTPKLYCIGPLIAEYQEEKTRPECLCWLDRQPVRSVVFLCFGSLGLFTAEQLKEIATGLERSGQRFLWVVRSSDEPGKRFATPVEPDLELLLPAGFLDRTAGVGLVVKSWAPQQAVLRHAAVGGFVTHCGWNSVLEAICAGVPMIGWPLYAEQWMNKVFLVEGIRLAAEMKGYDVGVVAADEVAARVRWLMESDGGRELRERTRAAAEAAAAAVGEGGSSRTALVEFVGELRRRGGRRG